MKQDKYMGLDVHQAMTAVVGPGCGWQSDSGNDGGDGGIGDPPAGGEFECPAASDI